MATGQPFWRATDFVPAGGFAVWIGGQLEALRPHFSADRPTLVVLTELNGLPLMLRGARLAARAPSFAVATALMIFRQLPATLMTAFSLRVTPVQAVQLLLAPAAARTYLRVCSEEARRHRVYLVSGSLPSPHFRLTPGRTLEADGPGIYNMALIFGPDGALIGSADKVNLTASEGPGGLSLSSGALETLRVFPTPVGDLGVAISLDAFEPEVIAHLEAQGATVLVQPDANGVRWTDPAHDGSGRDQPLVWLESSWKAVQDSPTLRYAVNPVVVGNFLGVPFDGQSAIVARATEAPQARSYVMTAPRPGFLRLMPWVTSGQRAELIAASAALAPGGWMQNCYHTGTLQADLSLPESSVVVPETTPHEQALRAFLEHRATFGRDPRAALLRALWILLWLGVTVLGLRAVIRRRRGGLAALLVGLIASLLVLG